MSNLYGRTAHSHLFCHSVFITLRHRSTHSTNLSTHSSIHLPIHPVTHSATYLSIQVCIHPSAHPSLAQPLRLQTTYLPFHPSLLFNPSTHLFTHPPTPSTHAYKDACNHSSTIHTLISSPTHSPSNHSFIHIFTSIHLPTCQSDSISSPIHSFTHSFILPSINLPIQSCI